MNRDFVFYHSFDADHLRVDGIHHSYHINPKMSSVWIEILLLFWMGVRKPNYTFLDGSGTPPLPPIQVDTRLEKVICTLLLLSCTPKKICSIPCIWLRMIFVVANQKPVKWWEWNSIDISVSQAAVDGPHYLSFW